MEKITKEEVNSIPVYYCKDCLSLAVKTVTSLDDACYCDDCGSTNIETASIDEWEAMYERRYGFKYLNNKY